MLPIDRTILKSLLLLAASIAAVLGVKNMVEPVIAHRAGTLNAQRDIDSGHPVLLIGGKRQPWHTKFERLAMQKHGLTMESLFDCCPTQYQLVYLNAYNSRVAAEVSRDYQGFSVEDLMNSANEEWTEDQLGQDSITTR